MSAKTELSMMGGWPRVRSIDGGGYYIQCYCLTVRMWGILQRIGVALIGFAGCALLAASTISLWGAVVFDAAEGTVWYRIANMILAIRWRMKALLVDQFPAAGEFLSYDPKSIVDWHLGAVALVLIVGVHPLASVLTKALALVFRPLVMRRISITITKDYVRVRGRLFATTLRRNDGIRFRKVSAESYHSAFSVSALKERPLLAPLVRRPAALVELVCAMRKKRIIFARYGEQAEAIVVACNEALIRTDQPFPI